jgi:hypothetical protein
MIRKILLAAALLAAAPVTASAEVVFIGTVVFTAVTSQCQNSHVGDRYPSVYHPKYPITPAATANANFSGLSFIKGHYADGHFLNSLAFDATFRTVVTGGVGWGDTYTRPQAQWAQIRLLSSVPATANITTATQTVTLIGQAKRLFSDPGGLNCIVTFRGVYVKDPFEAGS